MKAIKLELALIYARETLPVGPDVYRIFYIKQTLFSKLPRNN